MTTTQGEHAKTEALDDLYLKLHGMSKRLESSGRIDESDDPEAYPAILDAMNLVRRLQCESAQVAALTAVPSVSDGLHTLHDAILNRLSHAELLEKAHYLMELNSNQARTIGELQDLVEVATAQPAAPQGVAYAELPDVDALAQEIRRVDGSHNLGAGALAEALMPFLRASHGQAPGTANWWRKRADEIEAQVAATGSQEAMRCYTDMRTLLQAATAQAAPATQQAGEVVAYLDIGAGGYLDLGSALSDEALQQLPKGRHALVIAGTYGIDGYVAAPQPSPTAQAAPAAGAVAGQSVTVGPVGLEWLIAEVNKLPSVRAAEFDGEESDGTPIRWRARPHVSLRKLERLLREFLAPPPVDAAPTPAAQADIAPSPVGGCGLVDGAAICEAAAKKWEREAKRHKRAPGSLPSQHEARDLERARLCRNLAEKIRSTPAAPQPTQAQAGFKSGAKSFQTYAEANAYSKGYYAGKKAATQAQAGAVPLTEARHLFDAGWKAAARFCDREDVVADGIIGFGACPQFEAAFTAAHGIKGADHD